MTGITISKEQAVLARERCKGLPVEIRLQDYRELEGHFDRIVSIGIAGSAAVAAFALPFKLNILFAIAVTVSLCLLLEKTPLFSSERPHA